MTMDKTNLIQKDTDKKKNTGEQLQTDHIPIMDVENLDRTNSRKMCFYRKQKTLTRRTQRMQDQSTMLFVLH